MLDINADAWCALCCTVKVQILWLFVMSLL